MILFDCQFGASVPSRQSDSPAPPKHFQCRTRLLTNGPAFESFDLLCRREHEHSRESPPSALTSFSLRRSPGFCAKAALATWRTLSMQPFGSQADRWRRLIELLRAGDVERNPGVVRRVLSDRSARAERETPFSMTSSRRRPYDAKLEGFRAYFAPRGLRSLDDF